MFLSIIVLATAPFSFASDRSLSEFPKSGEVKVSCKTPECDKCRKKLSEEKEVKGKLKEEEEYYRAYGDRAEAESKKAGRSADSSQKGTLQKASGNYSDANFYLSHQAERAKNIRKISKDYSDELYGDCQGEAEEKAAEYKKYGEKAKEIEEQKISASNATAMMAGVTGRQAAEVGQASPHKRDMDFVRKDVEELQAGGDPYAKYNKNQPLAPAPECKRTSPWNPCYQ
jgi:hypothetical protein